MKASATASSWSGRRSSQSAAMAWRMAATDCAAWSRKPMERLSTMILPPSFCSSTRARRLLALPPPKVHRRRPRASGASASVSAGRSCRARSSAMRRQARRDQAGSISSVTRTSWIASHRTRPRSSGRPCRAGHVGALGRLDSHDSLLPVDGGGTPGLAAEHEAELTFPLRLREQGVDGADLLGAELDAKGLRRREDGIELGEVAPAVQSLAARAEGQAAGALRQDALAQHVADQLLPVLVARLRNGVAAEIHAHQSDTGTPPSCWMASAMSWWARRCAAWVADGHRLDEAAAEQAEKRCRAQEPLVFGGQERAVRHGVARAGPVVPCAAGMPPRCSARRSGGRGRGRRCRCRVRARSWPR